MGICIKMANSESELPESCSFEKENELAWSVNRKKKKYSRARKWSDYETQTLIDLLEERICLWDVFNKAYHLRDKREEAYEEIEGELKISVADIKLKITGLRSQLGREISKTNAKKSGQGLNDNYMSNWVYWDRLQFLVPVMQAGKSKDNLPDECIQMNADDDVSERSSSKGTPKTSKKCLESRKQDLISTCIQVLREPLTPQAELQNQCHFSKYVAEKLANFDKRTRTIAEKE